MPPLQLSFDGIPGATRDLQVYAFDPCLNGRGENHLVVRVPFEPLEKGPIGKKVAIIDYNASLDCYYDGIDLNLWRNGMAPSEANPQFHQQMVYAVVMDTVRRFEVALGREITWRKLPGEDKRQGRLLILPHAMHEANAFYDPECRALLFGYFESQTRDIGGTFPGQTVFTCLSHDIVVHETVHAVLDGLREFSLEPTGPDALAFHEGFADIIAILQHFSHKESLLQAINRTGGVLYRREFAPLIQPEEGGPLIESERAEANPLVELAQQFGDAMGHRRALRAALNTRPNPQDLDKAYTPHDRGAILVAAVFDAFFSVYVRRTSDLIRLAHLSGAPRANYLNADLANRLAREAAGTAKRLEHICIRALDYCPFVDITFGDFLRALVTADRDLSPDDEMGYRASIIAAFRARGIKPESITSYSEDSLAWDAISNDADLPLKLFRTLSETVTSTSDGAEIALASDTRQFLELVGVSFSKEFGLAKPASGIKVHSVKSLMRVFPDGQRQQQFIIEYLQSKKTALWPDDASGPTFDFRGGITVLVGKDAAVRCIIPKSIDDSVSGSSGWRRLQRERRFRQGLERYFTLASYVDFDRKSDSSLRNLHQGL